MQKPTIILLLFFLCITFSGFAQTTPPTDFFAGKWEISVADTPMGNIKLLADLVRKDGKLTGDLVNTTTPNEKRPITKIEESADKLVIYFDTSEAGEISINLTKVDDDNLKGSLMTFDATGKRVK